MFQYLHRMQLVILLGVFIPVTQATAQWDSFRNGGASRAEEPLPTSWSLESGISWQRELIGYGQSAPVVWNNNLYVTSVLGPNKEECVLTSLDVKSGTEFWNYLTPSATTTTSNYMHSRAAPTPLVDEQGVYAFYEGGNLLAWNHAGKILWQRNLSQDYGPFENNHGLGSSPAQTESLILLNLEHQGPSCLLAIKKQSGETIWKADRPSGSSWTSPIVRKTSEGDEVIISSAGTITSYAIDTGKERWSISGLEGNSVPSPSLVSNLLITGARLPEFGSSRIAAESNLCLLLNSSPAELPTVKWRAEKAVCDYASPVVCDNSVYFLSKVGVLHCLDLQTGELQYATRLGCECWATPIVSEDRIYFFGKNGESKIIAAGPEFELIASNSLWNPDAPPAPETYREFTGESHRHGEDSSTETADNASEGEEKAGGSRFTRMILRSDTNGNGVLEADEFPEAMREMLKRGDLNQDGKIDESEMTEMEKSFRERRAGSQDSARDPIVYGAAASDGSLFIRTGTRMYCIREVQ